MFNTLWPPNHKIMETKDGRYFNLLFRTFNLIAVNFRVYFIFIPLGRLREFAKRTHENGENIVRSRLTPPSEFHFGRGFVRISAMTMS